MKELVRWQKERGYPVQFACEATLNLAQVPAALELMKESNFHTVFCGIETPEEDALNFMHKEQNVRRPILESVAKLNEYGLEIVAGIIIGLDTDTPSTGERILEFIESSGIPMLTINILHALPKTPLWRRLEAADRIVKSSNDRESNVEFLLPYETVVEMWLKCVTAAFSPEAIFKRFEYQCRHTYPHLKRSRRPRRASMRRISEGPVYDGPDLLARGNPIRLPEALLENILAMYEAGKD